MTTPALELDLVGRVVARLKDQSLAAEIRISPDDLPTVEAALRLGDATPPKVPAAVVYLASDELTDTATPQVSAVQRVTAVLAVVHIIGARNTPRNAGGPATGAVVDPLALLTGRTRAVLNGWKPDDNARQDVLALRRGRLLEIANGRAVWQDEYAVSWRARTLQPS